MNMRGKKEQSEEIMRGEEKRIAEQRIAEDSRG